MQTCSIIIIIIIQCAVTKEKASEYFSPLQMGVACPSGAEKIIHGLRHCVEEHWMDENFAVMKIDMRNAFNLVSHQALLDECSAHFPELLPWASWCYGQHPTSHIHICYPFPRHMQLLGSL